MSRILAYTSPASGHLYPLVPGLLELQRRGHHVHVRTLSKALPSLAAVGLEASAVDPRILDVEVTDYRARSSKERLLSGLTDVMRRGALDGADLDDAIREFRPDALIVDANAYGALVHAEASRLPWALAMPSLLPLPEPGIPPYSLGLAPARSALGRVRDAALWPLVERAFGKAMLPGLNGLRRSAGLPEFASPLDQYTRPDLVLGLTGEPLEYPRRRLPSNVRLVGFQAWDPPAAAPDYLSEPGDPWILVTCSTDYQGDESLARVAVEALRDQPYRVLLTLADAFDGAALPSAGNVRAERFVPHAPVLERAAAVVTHSGMGIVGKATRAGVPVVAVPFGRDQPEIARRVVEAGTGVAVPAARLTVERLREAVADAVARSGRAREVAAELAAHDAPRAFADAVTGIVPQLQRS
ncbi:glycosyltransferase, MGT family [Paramicrobacterium humi]|uniref:Glycosyltransferase, MGT family n=1 Tax=Paramicrobacterium humi TaxID=640635 RepID=A0A1H4LQD4_9MICO|nr:nucleotide disphospho-sugar-binding domain-containing protein [Microbacterium humi]SEB72847.1 glycosyltransferase, MGT family [Microbacterium humi]